MFWLVKNRKMTTSIKFVERNLWKLSPKPGVKETACGVPNCGAIQKRSLNQIFFLMRCKKKDCLNIQQTTFFIRNHHRGKHVDKNHVWRSVTLFGVGNFRDV